MLLTAMDRAYTHPNTSGQFMVVAKKTYSESTLWQVVGGSKTGDYYPPEDATKAVKEKDIIRLLGIPTANRLHSHGDRLGYTQEPTQQEVTMWHGATDFNDDWRIEPLRGNVWVFDQPVRIVHCATQKNLHSHDRSHLIYTAGFQEVTAFSGRDENDLWIAERDGEIEPGTHSIPNPPENSPNDSPGSGDQVHVPADSGSAPMGTGAASDLPTLVDHLGQAKFVRGLQEFLSSQKTHTPLTISIEARWGAGKSSFMLKLRDALKRPEFCTVWFNPWRHEKNDELWAAFALSLVRQLERNLGWWGKRWAGLKYAYASMEREAIVSSLIPAILQTVLWLAVVIYGLAAFYYGVSSGDFINFVKGKIALKDSFSALTNVVGAPLAVVLAFTFLTKIADKWIGHPADIDIEKHLDRPDYVARTTFLENFHQDLRRLLHCYVPQGKIVIFIDDLDRCDVPRAAELIQGLNLLMSGAEPETECANNEEPKLIFILGIDRAKVAAGIAVKHEKLLPFLYPEKLKHWAKGKSSEAELARVGLEYGFDYLEKFIQIPFRLPKPDPVQVKSYISELLQRPSQPLPKEVEQTGAQPTPDRQSGSTSSTKTQDDTPTIPREIDEEWMIGPTYLAAPLLENNPRRIKQFIALLRLNAYLLSGEAELITRRNLCLLGKFLAVTLKWPTILDDLDTMPTLFRAVRYAQPNDASPLVVRWQAEPEFMDFIAQTPPLSEEGFVEDYDLSDADIQSFLSVAKVTQVKLINRVTRE